MPPENMASHPEFTAVIEVPGTYTTNPPAPEAAQKAVFVLEHPAARTRESVVPGPNTKRPKPWDGSEIVPDGRGVSPVYVKAFGSVAEPPSVFVTVTETRPAGCGGENSTMTLPITLVLSAGAPSK